MTRNLSPDNNFFEGGGRELELGVHSGVRKWSKYLVYQDKSQSALAIVEHVVASLQPTPRYRGGVCRRIVASEGLSDWHRIAD